MMDTVIMFLVWSGAILIVLVLATAVGAAIYKALWKDR